jgi:hypothetical protein
MFRLVKASSVNAVLMVVVGSVDDSSLSRRCVCPLTRRLEAAPWGLRDDLTMGAKDVDDLAEGLPVTGFFVEIVAGVLDTRRPNPDS